MERGLYIFGFPLGGLGRATGQGIELVNGVMLAADGTYDFRHGFVYNLESSRFIFRGGGASGAHSDSDIDNPEVGHAFWAAVLAQPGKPAAAAPADAVPKPAASTVAMCTPTAGAASGALEELVSVARGAARELGVRIRIEIEVEPPRE